MRTLRLPEDFGDGSDITADLAATRVASNSVHKPAGAGVDPSDTAWIADASPARAAPAPGVRAVLLLDEVARPFRVRPLGVGNFTVPASVVADYGAWLSSGRWAARCFMVHAHVREA